MDKFQGTSSPSVVNLAIKNIAIRYGVIKPNPLAGEGNYMDSYTSFSCMRCLKALENLAHSIEAGSGKATWAEYFKLTIQFALCVAKVKQMSVEAIQEVLVTEIKLIENNLQANIAREKAKATAQKQSAEETAKIMVYVAVGLLGVAGVFGLIAVGTSAWDMFRQHYLNLETIKKVRSENAELTAQNNQLTTELKNFKQFQQERKNLDGLKAENERLKKKVKTLNDEVYRCNQRPFWQREC